MSRDIAAVLWREIGGEGQRKFFREIAAKLDASAALTPLERGMAVEVILKFAADIPDKKPARPGRPDMIRKVDPWEAWLMFVGGLKPEAATGMKPKAIAQALGDKRADGDSMDASTVNRAIAEVQAAIREQHAALADTPKKNQAKRKAR